MQPVGRAGGGTPPQRPRALPRAHRHGGLGSPEKPLQREHPAAAERAVPALARLSRAGAGG